MGRQRDAGAQREVVRDRDIERQGQRERETETKKDRDADRERQGYRERYREIQIEIETESDKEGGRGREREGEKSDFWGNKGNNYKEPAWVGLGTWRLEGGLTVPGALLPTCCVLPDFHTFLFHLQRCG